MRILAPILTAVMLAGTLAGCAVSSGPPTAASLAEGRQRSAEMVHQLQNRGALIEDRALNAYMAEIVGRIAAVRPRGLPPIRPFIVKDADINAFTLGGDSIFINAGLIAAMESEAQLAMVIAHEIGHVDRGHISGREQVNTGVGLLGVIAAIGLGAAGVPGDVTGLGVGLAQNAAVSGYSRDQERDADAVSAGYLGASGYSVAEGARSFEVLRRVNGDRGGSIFSSHPMTAERQATLRRLAGRQSGGRVNARGYLRRTADIRRHVLTFLDDAGRRNEAAQLRRNLAAGR